MISAMILAHQSRRATRSTVLGPWLATVGISGAALVLRWLDGSTSVPDSWGIRGFPVLFAGAFGAVGWLIRIKVPSNRVGLLCVICGFLAAVQAFLTEYVVRAVLVAPGTLPLVDLTAWLLTWIWIPIAGSVTTLMLQIFPDGQPLSDRWRRLAWFSVATMIGLSTVLAFYPGPISNAPFIDNPHGLAVLGDAIGNAVVGLAFGCLAIAIVLSTLSLIRRYRRSRGVERQQLKWFALAAAIAGLALAGPGTLFNIAASGSPAVAQVKVWQILVIVSILGIPISVGIAILRYRLYEIDRLISRTISYAIMTAILAALYVSSVLSVQAILGPLTSSNTLAVAGSTLVVAAAFQPLRSRVQRVVDRRFNRAYHDAARTVATFGGRLRDRLDVESLRSEITATVGRTVEPTSVGLWIRSQPRGPHDLE